MAVLLSCCWSGQIESVSKLQQFCFRYILYITRLLIPSLPQLHFAARHHHHFSEGSSKKIFENARATGYTRIPFLFPLQAVAWVCRQLSNTVR